MESKEKREKWMMSPKSGFDRLSEGQWEEIERYCSGYKEFLNEGKTEYDCVDEAVRQAETNGFKRYTAGQTIQAGDKLYVERHNKTVILAVIGRKPMSEGTRIVASHIDCPRLDLKPYPLYEDGDMALMKTHYYGGVRKYQWLALPLELRGTVYRADGSKVKVRVGADEKDPVLMITDLLPHLSADQIKKPLSEAFLGENLNAIAGTRPEPGEGSDRIKLAVLEWLNEKYEITEADLQSAELSLVPAGPSRDVGFDRSMIGAYGHDDRSCSYAGMRALFDAETPQYTSVCVLADKEEIGSEGITGMQSGFFDTFMADLCDSQGGVLRRCYENSLCLSGDVCNAFDPNFPDVSDKRNNARLGYGLAIAKYTGRAGKGGSSDASSLTMSKTRSILDKGGVFWQMTELGKVDQGGGGTVAVYLAKRNIEVVDAGVPVLSMHAPYELVSKIDCYMAYAGFSALFRDGK